MSNYMGKTEMKAVASPQTLTASYVSLGTAAVAIPQANQVWIELLYTAGTEANGLDIVLRWLNAPGDLTEIKELLYTDTGDSLEAREKVVYVPKALAGKVSIPIQPNGRRFFKVYVKTDGAIGGAAGTVTGDAQFYLVD